MNMSIGKVKCLDNQNGIALITVILATALVAVMAVSMTFAQHLDIRRTANLLEGDRAMVLALGLEEWGRQVLIRDVKDRDHLGEDWALGLMPIATENGIISGSIVDLQGRINLNNLEDADRQQLTAKQLVRLFDFCEVDGSFALVQALADWLDQGAETRPGGGAEDNEYLLHEPAYLAANRLMASPSELLLVEGVTPDNYACLAEHIATLPNPTDININTAGAVVIAALADTISIGDAEEIVQDRPDNGYSSTQEFRDHPRLAASGITTDEGLTLTSDYFMTRGQAIFAEAEIGLYSLVARRDGKVAIWGRSIGTY